MHLFRRSDSSLAAALIVGTVILFQQPLRWLFDLTRRLELQYQLDLLPTLTILIVSFGFHQYFRRHEARHEARAATAETGQVRARAAELQQLMAFGRGLADALDRPALQQALTRTLPALAGTRECWVLTCRGTKWELLVPELSSASSRSLESLEALAVRVGGIGHGALELGCSTPSDISFPLVANGTAVGVMVVGATALVSEAERSALGTASTLIAIAVRNVQLLEDTRESAERDTLTGCLNREPAMKALEVELKRARRTARPTSLLMFDIDHFKTVNDTHGHLQGDAVLKAVGRTLNAQLRSTDLRCRFGGDEFLLILPDTPSLGAQQVAEGIRRQIAGLQVPGLASVSLTASIGVASAEQGELDETAAIARADEALYRAKQAGRNRFCVAAPKGASTGTSENVLSWTACARA